MTTTDIPLEQRLAIVTGASSGIGEAIAIALLAAGCTVVNADIAEPASIPAGKYHFAKTDVTNAEQVQLLYNTVAGIGVPGILVCNAGKGIHEQLAEGDPEKWARVIDLNVMGTLRVLRSFVPLLVEQPLADVVFISSVAARTPYEYGGIYGASKAAIEMLAQTLRLELKDNARVNIIAPGVVDTAFFTHLESGILDADSIGCGKLAPSEIADAVLYVLTRKPAQAVGYMAVRPTDQMF